MEEGEEPHGRLDHVAVGGGDRDGRFPAFQDPRRPHDPGLWTKVFNARRSKLLPKIPIEKKSVIVDIERHADRAEKSEYCFRKPRVLNSFPQSGGTILKRRNMRTVRKAWNFFIVEAPSLPSDSAHI